MSSDCDSGHVQGTTFEANLHHCTATVNLNKKNCNMLRFTFPHDGQIKFLGLAIIAIDKDNLLIIVHPIRKIINWCYQRSTCKTEGTRSPPACEARNIGSVPSLIARRRSSHTLHDDKYIFGFLEILFLNF